MLTMGVVGSSRMENEHRVPIHPDHFGLIPADTAERLTFESGYGERFGIPDGEIAERFGPTAPRERLLNEFDAVLLPKPLESDLRDMREGVVHWGWPHCVQQRGITQAAIDRRLTLLAWEAMFAWRGETRDMHLFARNNEMAGYCGVGHAMALAGINAHFGPPLRAVVLSFGSVSRGAVSALLASGVGDITVYTQRPPETVSNMILGARYGRMAVAGGSISVTEEDGTTRPLRDAIAEADIIVNGILQDTDAPLMYLREGEERLLKRGALIVDVSCDKAMGFPFAEPTSFETPVFRAGPATYYAVNHSPSWHWRSASWELSRVVVSFLGTVLRGPAAWEADETIRRCIEIRGGVIQNPRVLSFQGRSPSYPHAAE
jgi:N5-(carboxyethyl)ornithine synthase